MLREFEQLSNAEISGLLRLLVNTVRSDSSVAHGLEEASGSRRQRGTNSGRRGSVTMNHPIEPDELMAYFDGELLLDRAGATAAHLGKCCDCQCLAADFQSLSQRLIVWQVDSPGPGVSDDIAAALDERVARESGGWRRGCGAWWLLLFCWCALRC
jgi:hypothetical protein